MAEKAVQIFLDMGLTPPPKRTMSKTKQIFYVNDFPKQAGEPNIWDLELVAGPTIGLQIVAFAACYSQGWCPRLAYCTTAAKAAQ